MTEDYNWKELFEEDNRKELLIKYERLNLSLLNTTCKIKKLTTIKDHLILM